MTMTVLATSSARRPTRSPSAQSTSRSRSRSCALPHPGRSAVCFPAYEGRSDQHNIDVAYERDGEHKCTSD